MKRRKIFAVIATLMLLLSAAAMSGCSGGIDPAAIVETNLNANYKGEFDEEMAEYFTDLTSQEEADEAYEETIQVYIEEYITYFGVDEATLTDDFRAQLRELIVEMLTHVKYTVKNDGKTESDYTVLVTVKPVDLYYLANEDWDTMQDAFDQRNDNYEFSDYTDQEYETAYDLAIFEFVKSKLPEIGNMEAEEFIVRVRIEGDEDELWSNDDDIQRVMDAMVWL